MVGLRDEYRDQYFPHYSECNKPDMDICVSTSCLLQTLWILTKHQHRVTQTKWSRVDYEAQSVET